MCKLLYESRVERFCYLDFSKAFDTISHYGIFLKLMNRKVPVFFLKLIVYWYSNMKSCVRWEECQSPYFDVLTGIKQGGVLSPRIFTLYVDDLIRCLRNIGVGCHVLSMFLACNMYADDPCLITPSRGAKQKLLLVCEEFCRKSCLSFNTKKSKSLLFGSYNVDLIAPLMPNGEPIEFVTSWKYLGCTVINGKKLSFSTQTELNSFYASCNSILRSTRGPNEQVLMNLLY